MRFAPRLDALTGWAELAKSSRIAPSDGPSARSRSKRAEGGHIITKFGLSKLYCARRQGVIPFASLSIEVIAEFLHHDGHQWPILSFLLKEPAYVKFRDLASNHKRGELIIWTRESVLHAFANRTKDFPDPFAPFILYGCTYRSHIAESGRDGRWSSKGEYGRRTLKPVTPVSLL